ncbi:phage holin family protein, partial [Klebsiella pneumoniae]
MCDFFDFVGLSSNFVYIMSVFIGYIGIDLIGLFIKCFVVKKGG